MRPNPTRRGSACCCCAPRAPGSRTVRRARLPRAPADPSPAVLSLTLASPPLAGGRLLARPGGRRRGRPLPEQLRRPRRALVPPSPTMRLEITAPHFGSLTGKNLYFLGGRCRKSKRIVQGARRERRRARPARRLLLRLLRGALDRADAGLPGSPPAPVVCR